MNGHASIDMCTQNQTYSTRPLLMCRHKKKLNAHGLYKYTLQSGQVFKIGTLCCLIVMFVSGL